MALPTGGWCETPDGSPNPIFFHIIGWTIDAPRKYRPHAEAAEEICRSCPVLETCRDFAALSEWQSVTVAGWTAPSHTAAYPPWSPHRCIQCGGDLPLSRLERSGLRCLPCVRLLASERKIRWRGYTDDVDQDNPSTALVVLAGH